MIPNAQNIEYNFQKYVSKSHQAINRQNFQSIDCWIPIKQLSSESNISKESANYSNRHSQRKWFQENLKTTAIKNIKPPDDSQVFDS